MRFLVHEGAPPKRRGRLLALAFGSGMLVAIAGLGLLGFRVNLTSSAPIGLWQIRSLDRPVQRGDLVFVCPPMTAVMREARARGYLRPGLCPGDVAPLIKTVAATSGQIIEIGDEVHIDGELLAKSRLMARDASGRPMAPHRGGQIMPNMIYLHSDFPGSFDSRYFGPLPTHNILGLAQKVWTFAP